MVVSLIARGPTLTWGWVGVDNAPMPILMPGNGFIDISVKAVPGASRDEVSGTVGERLKVRVSAAPEGGKANRAIERVLSEALGVRAKDVEVVRGHTSAEKTVRVSGISAVEACQRLGLAGG